MLKQLWAVITHILCLPTVVPVNIIEMFETQGNVTLHIAEAMTAFPPNGSFTSWLNTSYLTAKLSNQKPLMQNIAVNWLTTLVHSQSEVTYNQGLCKIISTSFKF